MNEPTEIKYPYDENGEPYYAAAHIKGLYGLDFYGEDNLVTIFLGLQNEISELKTKIDNQDILINQLKKQIDENTKTIKKLSEK